MKKPNFYGKMGRTALSSLFYLFFLGLVYGQQPTKTSNPNDQWTIKWSASDEFNKNDPDWAKWIQTGNLPNTSAWKWNNQKNVKISNGIAELTMRHNANNTPDGGTYFTSGIFKSYQKFTYGYFEAKIQGADIGEGVCPSFWLYSDFDYSVANGETVYSEIDVVELQQFDWYEGHQDDIYDMDLNLHAVVKENGEGVWRRPKMYPQEQLNKWRAPWDPSKDFHIYGCEVNQNEIIWYVDGVEVARKPNKYWHRPMNVTLSLGLRKPFVKFFDNKNNAINPETDAKAREKLSDIPTSMYVDYVRVWEKSGGNTTNPPTSEVGTLKNKGFETGDLTHWDASTGTISAVSNNTKTGQYAGSVNNASIAQIVTLKANTSYKVSAFGKASSPGTSAYLGISKASNNELISNFEFKTTSYSKGEIEIRTGNVQESYRIWYWSSGQAYCDDFNLVEINSGASQLNENETETALEKGIHIYPNPYKNGPLTIDFGKPFSGEVQITGLNGRTFLRRNVVDQTSVQLLESKSKFKSGLYIVKISGPDGEVSKKILVE
ncbi:hypothetical protein B4Q04_15230 [Zobellia sp. OII3]|uniref:family 16 glycosylhydrolase n=1 Tax=Zobellia sp. OII3 TaxID=2034520 RepID=UPI000B537DF0|nr:family 16 glycosylhydrolase [Zobellia sp. OII3]OWW24668.1 hypothetical protein B4Q04_15230 [Zobellia sp. OII3]